MTAAGFQDVSFPAPDPDPLPSRPARPRNFLSAGEHRRLFWRVMPLAVVVVVALELLTRPAGPPPRPVEPQVDTRIERLDGARPEGAVVIMPADEPRVAEDESVLSASPRSLAKVRDATFFRQADEDAWFESCLTLRGYDGRALPKPRDVGFTEIYGQPVAFRGRAVRMRGTLHRLERLEAPRNDYGIDAYWQGWLEPADGPATPVIVHFLELPEGMPTGLRIREPVVVSGCFLKNMAYRAADTVRIAPLLLARAPGRPPAARGDSGGGLWDRSLGAIGVATMLGIVAAIAVGFLLVGRGRRAAPAAGGLDVSLADVEPFSVAESLQSLAAGEPARSLDQPEPSEERGA